MVVDLFRWPPKARQFQEVIAAAVESFSREGRSYNYTRSACEQLRERILELRLPEQMEALVMVGTQFGRPRTDLMVTQGTALPTSHTRSLPLYPEGFSIQEPLPHLKLYGSLPSHV